MGSIMQNERGSGFKRGEVILMKVNKYDGGRAKHMEEDTAIHENDAI